jgi:hypothetical protein
MDKDVRRIPLSESNVSLKLAEIQERCAQLLRDTETSLELTLEEPVLQADSCNPYESS